ncbi:MAG: transporter substrate-binding domain-containing protein [Ruminiclostridium sp.]|nr:transporter substrate-binding domain-containing protein [Ruminiclostridium sp.]
MKNTAKRTTALTIALALMITAAAGCGGSNAPAATTTAAVSSADTTAQTTSTPPTSGTVAVLSPLNITEDECSAMLNGKYKAINYSHGIDVQDMSLKAKFYDTLDAMIMALEAGEVKYAEVPHSVAQYLCAHNDKIECGYDKRPDRGESTFANNLDIRSMTGLSFMMLEKNTALRDEFDKAIADMKADGTLDKLVQEYITDAVDDETQKAVEFEKNGGETIKVGVTGSLPPIDYVAPDGTSAGFNTAILAEIGKRTGKNIELVQVDSIGRATALSSGTVDAVLWTRAGDGGGSGNFLVNMTDEERKQFIESKGKDMTPKEDELMEGFLGGIPLEKKDKRDIPDGVVITEPYFTDQLVMVSLK